MNSSPAAEKSRADRRDAPGSRPEGTSDEREAGARVRAMFGRIAPRYDFLNHFLSFSLDRLWRRRAAKRFSAILARPGVRVLDLCCGTGDLAFALWRRSVRASSTLESRCIFVGSDFALPMINLASLKTRSERAPI